MYFHRLIDFEDAIKCYEITYVEDKNLTPNMMSGLFGDALLGYMGREDFVNREDEMAVRWATQTVSELKGGTTFVAAGHMLHAGLRARKSRPTPLLDRFLKAVITIRLSHALYWTEGSSQSRGLFKYLKDRNLTEEHFFYSGTREHTVIASFRHRTGTDKADVVYINSGLGLDKHPFKFLPGGTIH